MVATADTPSISGIETLKWDSDCIIYPNPVKDMLIIKAKETIESIRIFSQAGILMHTQQDSAPVNMGSFPAGMYIVNIKKPSKTSNRKIIKE